MRGGLFAYSPNISYKSDRKKSSYFQQVGPKAIVKSGDRKQEAKIEQFACLGRKFYFEKKAASISVL